MLYKRISHFFGLSKLKDNRLSLNYLKDRFEHKVHNYSIPVEDKNVNRLWTDTIKVYSSLIAIWESSIYASRIQPATTSTELEMDAAVREMQYCKEI